MYCCGPTKLNLEFLHCINCNGSFVVVMFLFLELLVTCSHCAVCQLSFCVPCLSLQPALARVRRLNTRSWRFCIAVSAKLRWMVSIAMNGMLIAGLSYLWWTSSCRKLFVSVNIFLLLLCILALWRMVTRQCSTKYPADLLCLFGACTPTWKFKGLFFGCLLLGITTMSASRRTSTVILCQKPGSDYFHGTS